MECAIRFSKDQVHTEVVGQQLSMRTAIGLQKSDSVGLLLLDHIGNKWEAILPTVADIVAKHWQWHSLRNPF
jgi:hypothetical protein